MQLNKAQKKAVCHDTGPMLVLAGPGSGKTRVITERIKYLVGVKRVLPEALMVVTFTRAAALEMRSRYQAGGGASGILFGTFHSIFFSILKNAYKYTAADVVGADEQIKFVSHILKNSGIDIDSEKDTVDNIVSEISKVKSEQYNIEDYFPLSCSADVFCKIYLEYGKWLRKSRKIDFDDMIVLTYSLFKSRKDILAMYQKRFRYILVDEFQDINYAQYRILKMLAAPENNLFIVGDDDQSIYSFRGSRPEIMIRFEEEYEDVQKVILDTNYRCSGAIVKASSSLISNNKVRFEKNICSVGDEGMPVDIRGFDCLTEQNGCVADIINGYAKQGVNYSDIAVLYRTNIQPRALVNKLLEYNIPIRLKEGIPNIYEHWIAKDIIAYVRLGMGFRDSATFVRIMNKPVRYISKSAVDEREVSFHKLAALYDDKYWISDRIFQMEDDVKSIYKMKPQRGLGYIDKVIGYGDYLREYSDEHGIDEDKLRDIFEQLYYEASQFDNYEDWFGHIEEYGKWSAGKDEPKDAVSLMTMHGSKGLEFENVIIVDVNETIIPHKMSVKPEELEEERRMFYVGMTRAKKRLHLFYVKHRYNRELEPSRFLSELNRHLP